jgi:exopolysaccharide biosynthesis polyprenyl glycosylphosphotransferase
MGTSPLKWLVRRRAPFLLVLDVLAFQLAFTITYYLRFRSGVFEEPVSPQFFPVSLLLVGFWLVLYTLLGLYRPKLSTSRYEAITEVLKAVILGSVLLFFLSIDPMQPLSSTRIVLLTYAVLLLLFSGGFRALYRTLVRVLLRHRIGLFRSVIVGSGDRARRLWSSLAPNPIFGHEIVAVVQDTAEDPSDGSVPLYRLDDGIGQVLRNPPDGEKIEFVLIAMQPENQHRVMQVIDGVHLYDVRVMIVPDFFHILVGMAKNRELYGMPLIEVFPDVSGPATRFFKRLMDIVAALIMIVLGLPLMLLFGLLVMIESKGPPVYRQRRVGLRGKVFTLYKLRSMRADAEQATGAVWARRDDPRITRVGRFIRATRIDELPQAFNVLLGDMSLVGPRPERPVFVEEFARKIPFYTRRLKVKPGITGWAQVRRGYDQTIEDVKEKLQYDLFYLENLSVGLDIKILLNTLWVVLTARGT